MTDSDESDRGEKSAEAFRTISEVADELGVPQHVLRFWETKFAQVKPMKRAGGRRYYRPDDVALLRRIQALLYSEGFTIRGVQKLLRERGVRALIDGAGLSGAADEGGGTVADKAAAPEEALPGAVPGSVPGAANDGATTDRAAGSASAGGLDAASRRRLEAARDRLLSLRAALGEEAASAR